MSLQAAIPTADVTIAARAKGPTVGLEQQMASSRLGVFSALYLALRAKHPPTAAHCLRVALGCSKWAVSRNIEGEERQLLEIAALLHDVGKIGVPDVVLQKPTRLADNEQILMQLHGDLAIELLAGAGARSELLDTIRSYRQPFLDSETNQPARLSIAARMINIVDAFDAMTSEHVFRKAMSRERAVAELFENAGSQFDPDLVKEFSDLITQPNHQAGLANSWLTQLAPHVTPGFCEANIAVQSGAMQTLVDTLYHQQMLNAMGDAAIYVDYSGSILTWNRAAERITGRNSSAVLHNSVSSALLGLVNESGEYFDENSCPLRLVLKLQSSINVQIRLKHVDGRVLRVTLNGLPVSNSKQGFCGAIFLIRDASVQALLEERVQNLAEIATTDALTGVSNRAQLDRRLTDFVEKQPNTLAGGSLIICDIDHFKRINDNFGHPAGDEALVTFAQVLKKVAREGDTVARYGGEEFVLLCPSCDIACATSRAEEIRKTIETTPIPALRGSCMTASFGVTEVQAGDNDDSFLGRADRALLMAKDGGRNRVVQLGAGGEAIDESAEKEESRVGWFGWLNSSSSANKPLVEKELLTSVPQDVALQKLSGFINDHKAEIVKVEGDDVILKIDGYNNPNRRSGDRLSTMLIEIKMEPVDVRTQGRVSALASRCRLWVKVRTARPRDRRLSNIHQEALRLLVSFQAYLVAQEVTDDLRENIFRAR